MTALPPTTKTRLQKIPQASGIVWEGDRRPLGNMAAHLDLNLGVDGECIIWVDGTEGTVRAMDIVEPEMGIEAVVRTLLRAIESPHHPGQPQRPQKIVVRDREIQFFLRGVLQDLEINIEHAVQLPLIDRLFESFDDVDSPLNYTLPTVYQDAITNLAYKIWEQAPWELLADSDILRVELKNCQIQEVYLCIMGMMSAEYGVLLYRSLDSLKQFRAAALGNVRSPAELEKAFLAQDCWFLNYEDSEAETDGWIETQNPDVEPLFGSLHPLEGMRPFIDEEEAEIVYAVLETLLRFCDRHSSALSEEPIEALSKSYRITLPTTKDKKVISTKISTLPDITEELLNLGTDDSNDLVDEDVDIPIQEDLIPDGSLVTLASIPWELVEQIKVQPKTYYQALDSLLPSPELPTIFIQTTRPKAKQLIDQIQDAGGMKSVCFNPGQDPFSGESYQLGMLQTEDEELHIFAEYSQEIAQQVKVVEKWHQRCQQSQGYCGLAIAMGATGNNRGNPQLKDILALFELKSINGQELGMGILQLMPNFEL